MNTITKALVVSTLLILISCGSSPKTSPPWSNLSDSGQSLDSGSSSSFRLTTASDGGQILLEGSAPSSTTTEAFDAGSPSSEEWWELGDSLTYGIGTTPTTGYRKPLYDWSRRCGAVFVGTTTTGDWPNALHDGHPGFTIENLQTEVRGVWRTHVPHADLVILLAGTNDMGALKGVPYDGAAAAEHYAELLDAFGDVDILVSTIPPMSPVDYPGPSKNVDDFNGRLRAIWTSYNAAHARQLLIADANRVLSPWSPERFVNTHMNAVGYGLLGAEFERVLARRCAN